MLYQFLIANGRADLQMIREFFPEFPFEELFRLVNEKKVSVHYEQLGKAWYRAPYYRSRPKDPVREYVLKNPGVSPTEVMKALEMNRATFYKRVKELGIITEKDGNNAKLYVEEVPQEDPFKQFQKDPEEDRAAVHYSPTRVKPQEDRSEPVEEPEDVRNRMLSMWKFTVGPNGDFGEEYRDLVEDLEAEELVEDCGDWYLSLELSDEEFMKQQVSWLRENLDQGQLRILDYLLRGVTVDDRTFEMVRAEKFDVIGTIEENGRLLFPGARGLAQEVYPDEFLWYSGLGPKAHREGDRLLKEGVFEEGTPEVIERLVRFNLVEEIEEGTWKVK